jgi:nicotinamide-nucleotide amidase
LDVPLVENTAILDELRQRFAERNIPFAPMNRQQACFPEGSVVLPTEVGSAAGFRVKRDGTSFDFYPGVPKEFRWFAERHGLPLIAPTSTAIVLERRWRFHGGGESQLANELIGVDLRGVVLHYTARFPEVHLFARLVSDDCVDISTRLDALQADIVGRLGRFYIGEGEEPLAERLGAALVERGWRITAAESCTGGQIGQVITSASGSSAYFDESFVTYSNEAKQSRLGVKSETLDRFGAVSVETAVEMAVGAQTRSGAELAVAVTGIAGPTGGTPEKPVGTVHIALATPNGVFHKQIVLLKRSREQVRTWTTWAALTAALWYLEERLPESWERIS